MNASYRIEELRQIARDEDLPFSESSAIKATLLLERGLCLKKPSVFLLGNGNLRLVWIKNNDLMGLQVLPEGLIQYVMMKGPETHSGKCDQDELEEKITELGMAYMIR
jgi:hypothetical protein